jgi:light-regulated signal transduction histidine kinase (bacteriophytochrome)
LETGDGQYRYFQQIVFLLPTETGFRLASTIRDITARKEVEETNRKLNEELEQRVQIRTRELESTIAELESFGYTISHNLRAPLRALDGHAAILQQENQSLLPDTVRSHLERIQVNAQQMGRMVDELLIFHRLSRSPMEKVTLQPAEVIRDVLHEIRPDSADRKIGVVVQELPICQADRSMLRLVFRNLILNALKFTQGRETANIVIGSERGNDKTVYYVRDDGVGFDQRYADKLFGTFQQLHGPKEFEGMGMGLAIVQRIIHRHGGLIWAHSRVNEGATFYFTLD